MLKKIRVDQVRLGMHLHALEGAWMDHPFWKTRFVIRDAEQLKKLHDSVVAEVWIDPEKGLDVADEAAPPPLPSPARAAAPATPAAPVQTAARPASTPVAAPSRSFAEEMRTASAVCEKGKAQVQRMFNEARLGRVIDAEAFRPLVQEISDSVIRNPGAFVSLARLKTQDDYSYMHSVAVCALMVALGRELGFDEEQCRTAGTAGLLHDVGKALMPLAILNKPGKLTDAEFDVMRSHPVRGHELLQEARGTAQEAMEVCLHHHERFDGGGYPDGLAGARIPRLARIVAACDAFDALTTGRPYRPALSAKAALAVLVDGAGIRWDPQVVDALKREIQLTATG